MIVFEVISKEPCMIYKENEMEYFIKSLILTDERKKAIIKIRIDGAKGLSKS